LRHSAHRDALLLLLRVLGISRAALHADPGRILTLDQQARYESLILRRLANEPIQYITGEQEFYSLALHVSPAVLIPRPETEFLVEAVLAELDPASHFQILDVGTGSGAIAIALAHHLPNAHVTATDISSAALAIASSNAARHHLSSRIRFVEADLLDFSNLFILSEGAAAEVEGPAPPLSAFDAIVSNPPYVPAADRATLHPQVRDFEPAAALFAGPDGLEIYRRLIPQARAALKPGGLLALEIGHGQRDAVAALLAGWNALRFVDDLQQVPRTALARKP
jgi:release factor glutamine methyltransferase